MTEQEMYREIMSRYALNPEKIRVNALKQAKKPAWQRFASDYWKPAAGIAAAVAVTVSAVGYMNSNSPRPEIDITVDSASALSAARRLSEAEQNYFNLQSTENTTVNIYVTFCEPMCCNDVRMALSGVADAGEIEIVSLYLDSATITGAADAAAYMSANGEEKTVIAVKISTPSMYYRSIQDLSAVYLAEIGSDEINDDTFSPIIVEDNDPLINDRFTETTTVVTAVPVTTTSFSFDSETSVTTPESVPSIGDSADNSADTLIPPESDDEDDPEEENPEEDVEDEEIDEPDETDETETTKPAEAEVSLTEETTTSQTEAVEIPSNEITDEVYQGSPIGLLTELYELKIENSTETVISGDNAVVLTKNGVYLYTLGLITGEQGGVSVEIGNPKIAFKNSESIVITGCSASGARDLISVVSLEENKLRTYDVSTNIGASDLGTINYSSAQNKYFVKTVSETCSFIYEVQISAESGVTFRPLVESQDPVGTVGFKDNLLYLSIQDAASGTKLYSFNTIDGETKEVAAFTENMKIKRGDDFESFALISESGKYVYDLNRNMAISVDDLGKNVRLTSRNGNTVFRVDDRTYEITEDCAIEELFGADVFPVEQSSEFKIHEITSEKIVISRDNGGSMWG